MGGCGATAHQLAAAVAAALADGASSRFVLRSFREFIDPRAMRGHRFETSDLAVEPLEDVGIHLVLVELVEHLVAAVLVELELHVLAAGFQMNLH